MPPPYSIDSSSLIDGFRETFPYNIVPAFWDRDLPTLINSGALRATEEVQIELEAQDDELLAWMKEYQDDLFVEVDEAIQLEVRRS